MNPELRKKWARFRRDRRGWRSLLCLAILFAASLPAELICNPKPLAVRFHGRWYFPAFHRYLARDFGGTQDMEPDYRDPAFLHILGHASLVPAAAVAESAVAVSATTSVTDQFDAESGEPAVPGPESEKTPLRAPAGNRPPAVEPRSPADILSRFDAESWDVAAVAPAPTVAEADAPARAFILWAPIRYGYATIATHSQSGRDALAAPFRQKVPATGAFLPSSWVDGHYLGTDDRGRDVLARLIFGFRVSLLFGLTLAAVSVLVGMVLGGIQGFFGGWTDLAGQRLSEIWSSLPRLYLLMILSSILVRSIWVLFVITVLTSWMGIGQYVRAEFLRARNFEYVRAARALGVSNWMIMRRHLLPNSLTPVITLFPFLVTGGILALVSLDFLNLGVPSPYPSLGELLSQGQANLQATWIIVPTFVLLSGTITLLTFIGDGVRNAFDPRRH